MAEHQHIANTFSSCENRQHLTSHLTNLIKHQCIKHHPLLFSASSVHYLINSYVSPSNGLNGFPVRSHCEATADTAKAATHCSKRMSTQFISRILVFIKHQQSQYYRMPLLKWHRKVLLSREGNKYFFLKNVKKKKKKEQASGKAKHFPR